MENTQKIKKSDLKIIYSQICQGWQSTLNEYLLWSEGKYVELPNNLIEKGYDEANSKQKELIKQNFIKMLKSNPNKESINSYLGWFKHADCINLTNKYLNNDKTIKYNIRKSY